MADLPPKTKPTITDCMIACMTAYGLGDRGADAALDATGSLPFSSRAWRWFGGRRKTPDQSRTMGINLMVWGDPGVSKTSCFNYACRVIPKNPYEIILSQSEAGDVGGLPRVQSTPWWKKIVYRTNDGVFTQKVPDAFFKTVSLDPLAVLWEDDFTNCDRSVQAAILGVALNRRVPDGRGGWIYLNHMPQLGAANHGDAHSLAPMLGPAANRWGHVIQGAADDGYLYMVNKPTIRLGMTAQEQADLQANKLGRDFVPSQLRSRIDALPNEWNERYASAFNLVSAYIREVGPKKAVKEPAPSDFTNVEDYAWPTYRTWELAARFIAVAEHFNMEDKRLIQAAVGLEAAGLFMDFRNRMVNMPSVDDVFNGKVNWSQLKASETTVLLQQAGSACANDQQLDAVFSAINTVKGINEELVRPSEDILVQRAKGLIHNKPLTPSMIEKVRAHIPPRIQPAGLRGTVAQKRALSKWLDPWSDTPPWGIEGPEILAA